MGKLNKELRMGIHNRFDIEVVDVETGEVKQRAQALNVVCNSYYSTVLAFPNVSSSRLPWTVGYGSGSGTPAATDTALFNKIGAAVSKLGGDSTYGTYDNLDFSEEHDGIWKRLMKCVIPNTQSVGATITEVGLATSDAGSIFTHAMLQDMNGNPISIQHTSTDVINIYCSIYLHYAGQSGDIRLFGSFIRNYDYQNRTRLGSFVYRALLYYDGASYETNSAYGATRYRLAKPGIAASFRKDGLESNAVSISASNFSTSSANKSITLTVPQLPISKGNGGCYNKILFEAQAGSSWYWSASPTARSVEIRVGGTTIPSFSISDEGIGTGDGSNTKFKTKTARPYNSVVKVNGVVQSSGVTIKKWGLISASANSNVSAYDSDNYTTDYKYVRYVSLSDVDWDDVSGSPYSGIYADKVLEVLDPEIGLYRINAANGKIKGSNDGTTWYDVETNTNNAQMNQAGAHYRYYKSTDGNYSAYINAYDGYNVIFDTAPAQGDVVTIDYTTDYFPKDSDHVLDVTLTLTFGEWTGE